MIIHHPGYTVHITKYSAFPEHPCSCGTPASARSTFARSPIVYDNQLPKWLFEFLTRTEFSRTTPDNFIERYVDVVYQDQKL